MTGSRVPRIVVTFSPLTTDVPRLPWNASPSQLPYRTQNGSFRCSWTSSWWTSAGVALAPSSSWAASPGSRFITT